MNNVIMNAIHGYKYASIQIGRMDLLSSLSMNCWNIYTPKQQLLNFMTPFHLDVSKCSTINLERDINDTIPKEAHSACEITIAITLIPLLII